MTELSYQPTIMDSEKSKRFCYCKRFPYRSTSIPNNGCNRNRYADLNSNSNRYADLNHYSNRYADLNHYSNRYADLNRNSNCLLIWIISLYNNRYADLNHYSNRHANLIGTTIVTLI